MSTDDNPAAPGKSLFSSKTVISLLIALVFYVLPYALNWVGVPTDQQPQAVAAAHQFVTPLAIFLGVVFRGLATKQITHVIPTGAPPAGKTLSSVLVALLAIGVLFGGSGLSGCATSSSATLALYKADAAAWSSFDAADLVLDGLVKAGVIKGQEAAAILAIEQKARATLIAADAALTHGNLGSAQENVTAAGSLIAQLIAVYTSHGGQPALMQNSTRVMWRAFVPEALGFSDRFEADLRVALGRRAA